jgi:hypothetical protein
MIIPERVNIKTANTLHPSIDIPAGGLIIHIKTPILVQNKNLARGDENLRVKVDLKIGAAISIPCFPILYKYYKFYMNHGNSAPNFLKKPTHLFLHYLAEESLHHPHLNHLKELNLLEVAALSCENRSFV